MDIKRCVACGRKFQRIAQVQQQTYCSSKKCQKERRKNWQQEKRRKDPDYRDNQSRAQQAWGKRNPEYWQEYRRSHPEYRERNRTMQKKRASKKKATKIAKMDLSTQNPPVPSGIYLLTPLAADHVAKMNEWIVEIRFISNTSKNSDHTDDDCKERT